MHTGKVLVGNSGDRVYLQDNKVIKEAGVYPIKFKQQMDWLKNCTHPNFIKMLNMLKKDYDAMSKDAKKIRHEFLKR